MHRRSFLVRGSLAVVGATLLPGLLPDAGLLQAAAASSTSASAQLTDSDRALLQLLFAYSANTCFCGGQVFTRATGIGPKDSPSQLLVQVSDTDALVAFLRSGAVKSLGVVRALDNTLNFTFQGTAYSVTNLSYEEFSSAVAGGGLPGRRAGDGDVPLFLHETLFYNPATHALSDPSLALNKRAIGLAATPVSALKPRFQTLVQGWLESARYGLPLGKGFKKFQDELLAAIPSDKAAKKVVQVLLGNISALSAAFNVAALRPLLTSPLVSASLKSQLGLDANDVVAAVEKLRAEFSSSDYPDAALWLTALLGAQIQDGTAVEWLNLLAADNATFTSVLTAFSTAQRLVGAQNSGAN